MQLQEHLDNTFDIDVDQEIELQQHPEGHPELEQTQRFSVDDKGAANWAMRKLARIRKLQAENAEVAAEERRRIDEWVTRENDKLERHAQFFEGHLTDFHRRELEADPKAKTISLPTGKLESKARQPKVIIDDVDEFIAWASKERAEFVRMTPAIAKAAVNDAVLKDGEILPHVFVEKQDRSFTVKPDLGGGS